MFSLVALCAGNGRNTKHDTTIVSSVVGAHPPGDTTLIVADAVLACHCRSKHGHGAEVMLAKVMVEEVTIPRTTISI